MLIVSKFHDYYDTIKTFGIDKSIVYKRKTEEIKEDIFNDKSAFERFFYYDRELVRKFKVSVCGTVYKGLYYEDKYYYEVESFIQAIRTANAKYYEELIKRNKYIETDFKIEISEKLFNEHIKYRTPIITQQEKCNRQMFNEKDSCLKNFNFEKIIDPFTMFQKVQQFISGVLTNKEKEPWPISDKLKAESHGYDKFSFRKLAHQRKG
jgi:hypothetical protein